MRLLFYFLVIYVTLSFTFYKNESFPKNDKYFIDSLSYEILSSIKGQEWYSVSKVHLYWVYDISIDCKYTFIGCFNNGDSLPQKTIDEYIVKLFNNKAYQNFIKTYSSVYCKGVKKGQITNYITLYCDNLPKKEIKKIMKSKYPN